MNKYLLFCITAFCMLGFNPAKKGRVIQVDVRNILNARPVTVFHNGRLITWSTGIDGGGKGDGYLTMSAAIFNGDKAPHALPDDAVFAANASHPKIVLHYNNNDTVNNQTLNVAGEGSFIVNLPAQRYTSIYLCLTSAEGPSHLQLQMAYEDGTEQQDVLLPDYYNDLPPNDPGITYLAHDLAKWNSQNNMAETDHHNIDAVILHPDAKRMLKAIQVSKTKAGYLVFWGATGMLAE